MLTLEGITVQTPIGPITLMTEMPIIPTPLGPITIEKAKKEEVAPTPIQAQIQAPIISALPLIIAGVIIGGVVIYFITKRGK